MSRSARLPLALLLVATATPLAAAPGQRILRTPEYRDLQERLGRGWNTWNTTSVLSHAHLPEGFAITLGLKRSSSSFKRHRKTWFLEEVYEELLSWNRWWPGARECRGALCWGSDKEEVALDGSGHTWQAALYESGLDNSPMYDGVPFGGTSNLLGQEDVGLTALYVADCNALSEIAGTLGRTAGAAELRRRGASYAAALRGLWDEKSGMYHWGALLGVLSLVEEGR